MLIVLFFFSYSYYTLAKLFRSLRVDAIVEPLRIFSYATPEASNQRPDILLRNLKGFGRQVILDVAVTAVDGQSRTSDDAADRPRSKRFPLFLLFFSTLVNFMGGICKDVPTLPSALLIYIYWIVYIERRAKNLSLFYLS